MNYPAAELRGINSSHKELFEAELRGIDPHEIKLIKRPSPKRGGFCF
jgi:hypothetical protein